MRSRTATTRLALAALLVLPGLALAAEPVTIVLATTTSTQDTGLLDVLLPAFEKAEPGIKVKPIAVGSGEAMAMGRRGDADVLVVHAPKAEEQLMAEGHGWLRHALMSNDFLLVGPASDPAAARGKEVGAALKGIAAAGAPFVSRGDRSGTHTRELALWKQAGISPSGSWYLEVGQGMGAAARIASEKGAYTLVDRGTYLALRAGLALVPICEGGAGMQNFYSVIVIHPDKHPGTHAGEGKRFADWLVSPAGQKLIGEFGVARFGRPLFVPAGGAASPPAS